MRASLAREDDSPVSCALAEAWLLQDDLDQAAAALGRSPDTFREPVSAGRLSALWRLHGRLASARGDQSRAIAHQGRALKQAEIAHDSRGIGLAHYELARCYRKVGDVAIIREHITKAASALHAAGDLRHLALVHSLSGISYAEHGRSEEAMSALGHAERLAASVQANDVVATVCGNQANVLVLEHRYEQARMLSERSVAIHEAHGSGHGLAVALATLGHICIRLGDLTGAEQALHRALDVRSPIQFQETTGAVFDSLAQIHLMRGSYDAASDFVTRADDAYGAYGRQTSHWYKWSFRVLGARVALRQGRFDEALARADDVARSDAPRNDALPAMLVAAEALTLAGRVDEAEQRLTEAADVLDPRVSPATWGEYLRLRGALRERQGVPADVYHDFAQSVTVLELLGERYEAALSNLALGRLIAATGARSHAEQHLDKGYAVFAQPGAERDMADTQAVRVRLTPVGTGENITSPADADEAIVRRIVDAAALPDLLGRETATALVEAADGDASVVFVLPPSGTPRFVAAARTDEAGAATLIRTEPPR